MEKKVSAEFVSLVFCSQKGSRNLLCIISGENHVNRAISWCKRLLAEGGYYSCYCTLRVVETALNTIASTASYLRFEGNARKSKYMNVEYFNL